MRCSMHGYQGFDDPRGSVEPSPRIDLRPSKRLISSPEDGDADDSTDDLRPQVRASQSIRWTGPTNGFRVGVSFQIGTSGNANGSGMVRLNRLGKIVGAYPQDQNDVWKKPSMVLAETRIFTTILSCQVDATLTQACAK